MNSLVKVVIALGGNEKDTRKLFSQVLEKLYARKEFQNIKSSRLYETAPISPIPQSRFLNAAVSFETTLSLEKIFSITEEIESSLGKLPKPKNAPRPIDIDLIFYGDHELKIDSFEIPHPRWKERLFVLYPLADLFEKAPKDTITLHERIKSFPESERQEIIPLY